MSTNNDSDSGKSFLLGILVGGAIGAFAALLLAPKKGDELRSFLAEKSTDYAGVVKSKATVLADAVQQNVGQVKAKSEEVLDKASGGVDVVKEKAATLASEASAQLKNVTSSVRDAIATGLEAGHNVKAKLQAELNDNPSEPGA